MLGGTSGFSKQQCFVVCRYIAEVSCGDHLCNHEWRCYAWYEQITNSMTICGNEWYVGVIRIWWASLFEQDGPNWETIEASWAELRTCYSKRSPPYSDPAWYLGCSVKYVWRGRLHTNNPSVGHCSSLWYHSPLCNVEWNHRLTSCVMTHEITGMQGLWSCSYTA